MQGNNTQTKQGFITSLSHPRKRQLAEILMADSGNVLETAREAGFNDLLIKEMSREIRKSVEGMQDFKVNFSGEVIETTEDETTDQNPTTESTDQTIEDQTVTDTPVDPVQNPELVPGDPALVPASGSESAPSDPAQVPTNPVPDTTQGTPDQTEPRA